MVEISKELHLTKSSQAEHGMIEWGNLLYGDLLSGWLVEGGAMRSKVLVTGNWIREYCISLPNYTISTLTNHILNIILFANVERDLPRARWVRLTGSHFDNGAEI